MSSLRSFVLLLQFFTRLPLPWQIPFEEGMLSRAIVWLPLVGVIIGSMNALAYMLGNVMAGPEAGVFFAMGANLFLTGAFHLDGLADTCDGIYSSRKWERMLEIMKDSRFVRKAAGLDGAFLVEPDWQEIDFGRWEKRHYQDIAREEPAAWQSLCDDWQAFCYPQGESFRMFAERVIGAWQKWQQAAAREEKDLLVASHGGVLKVIRLFAEARPWEDFWQLDISLGEVQLMSLPVR